MFMAKIRNIFWESFCLKFTFKQKTYSKFQTAGLNLQNYKIIPYEHIFKAMQIFSRKI